MIINVITNFDLWLYLIFKKKWGKNYFNNSFLHSFYILESMFPYIAPPHPYSIHLICAGL